MTKDLIVTFGKSNGQEHDWTYKDLDPSLSIPEIKEACELLTTLDIFEQDGVNLFDSVKTAKILTHKEKIIFSPEIDPTPEVDQPTEATCEEVRCFEVSNTSQAINRLKLPQVPFFEQTVAQSRERHFEQLTQIPPLENTDRSIKIEPSVLPSASNIEQKQDTVPISASDPPVEKGKKDNQLLLWIRRIRNRNKEDPRGYPRE